MKSRKQFRIEQTGREPIFIDPVDDEQLNISVCDPLVALGVGKHDSPYVQVSGLRWREDKHYQLEWGTFRLRVDDRVTIVYEHGAREPTPPQSTDEYLMPEPQCAFCYKRASEVEFLVERNVIARICSECVETCRQEIEGRRESLD